MSEYKPGTVALVRLEGNDVVAILDPQDDWFTVEEIDGYRYRDDEQITNVRPLRVLADDEAAVKADDLRSIFAGGPWSTEPFRNMQAVMDAYDASRTPQVDEPQGIGAVVVGTTGARFVRTEFPENPWCAADSPGHLDWADINATRVLSEGVRLDQDPA